MISIGTGVSSSTISSGSKISWLMQISSSLITAVEQYTHEYVIGNLIDSGKYYRF
jgi:hypothetical protein